LVSRALATALAVIVVALLLATPHVDTQAQSQVEVKIRWVTYRNPTGGRDYAFGACIFDDYVAVMGEAGGRLYVALLHKSDGRVVRGLAGGWWGRLYNCISIEGKLYAAGYTSTDTIYGVIYVFDVNLNVLARILSEDPSGYTSLAYDGEAVYLAGWAEEDVNRDGRKERVWLVERIEKKALDTSSFPERNSKKIYFDSWKEGWIHDIGVEPSTGRIWATGFYKDSNDKTHSLIVVFDGDLRELKVIDYPDGSEGYLGELYGIAFDGRYAYVSGGLGVAKFTLDGELVAVNRDGRTRTKIVYGYDYLYTFGEYRIGGYLRHVLYIHDTDLNLVKRYVLSEKVDANSYFYIGKPALEGNNTYVAGYVYDLDPGVIVYALSIEGVTATTTTTVTTTPTTATTITTTVTITVPTTTTITTTVTEVNTVTVSIPITVTITTTTPVTTTATAYTTIITTTTIPILRTVTETLERTVTTEKVVEKSVTIVERITTPTIIGLIAAGTLLAIAFLLLKRR